MDRDVDSARHTTHACTTTRGDVLGGTVRGLRPDLLRRWYCSSAVPGVAQHYYSTTAGRSLRCVVMHDGWLEVLENL